MIYAAMYPALASLLVSAMAISGAVHAQDDARGLTASRSSAQSPEAAAIGLVARLDRADPTYAVGEELRLTITTARAASIEVWELDAKGVLSKILPAAGHTLDTKPNTPMTLPPHGMNLRVGPPKGVSELHIIARTPAAASRSIGTAGAKFFAKSLRAEVRLKYTIM
jgi:hypothetical protein